jgi:SAM-dependent methyltransferase
METIEKTAEQLKQLVQEKYSKIALQTKSENETSCCGSGCCDTGDTLEKSAAIKDSSCCDGDCCTENNIIMAEDYSKLKGYAEEADLGLGCGLPTEYAQIKTGDIVVDLGSGAGNDCLIARAEAGETGKVIGVDFTEKMIEKARINAQKLGYTNVEFVQGDIENMPLSSNLANVVVSNCVLNLVPDKEKAFSEIFRILKPGGHFSVSDIVLEGNLPEGLQQASEMYAGCVSGAIQQVDYIKLIEKAGFEEIKLQKKRKITIPDSILLQYISKDLLDDYKSGNSGIFSITVYADKPGNGINPGFGC